MENTNVPRPIFTPAFHQFLGERHKVLDDWVLENLKPLPEWAIRLLWWIFILGLPIFLVGLTVIPWAMNKLVEYIQAVYPCISPSETFYVSLADLLYVIFVCFFILQYAFVAMAIITSEWHFRIHAKRKAQEEVAKTVTTESGTKGT